MKVIAVLPVPIDSRAVWLQFRHYVERFAATWMKYPPGCDIEIAAVCCNSDANSEVRMLFLSLPVRFFRYDGHGADLGAQQWLASQIGGNPFLICCTSRMYFHREGWGKALVDARDRHGPGLYGMSASYESGSLHVCTRGYCLDAEDLRAYPTQITSRDLGVFFECGGGNLLNWFEQRGGTARMVYWDGVWEKADWMDRPNTFRKGNQRNMLAFDKHSDIWAAADEPRRRELEQMCFQKTRHPSNASGPLKIAGLLPLKVDPEKSKLQEMVKNLSDTCDEIIVLHDNPEGARPIVLGPVTEHLKVEGLTQGWDDFSNRATLLIRAAKYGCRWGMQLDDDETMGPTLTRERVHDICQKCEDDGYVQVVVKVRTAWNETRWRTDGVFGVMIKSFLVKNPYMLQHPEFEYGPDYALHHFPTLNGPKLVVDDYIIHWGLRSPSLRKKNVEKYQMADPENKLSGVQYDYLNDETGIILEPL